MTNTIDPVGIVAVQLSGTGQTNQWEVTAVVEGRATFEPGPATAVAVGARPLAGRPPMRTNGWSTSRWSRSEGAVAQASQLAGSGSIARRSARAGSIAPFCLLTRFPNC
ncbi:MAG TPA: hypothetical protein VFR76_01520 [Verrucomicrobiae bacterium]|nr:hypothetical protein [Verrucomicrobiae bacterium]